MKRLFAVVLAACSPMVYTHDVPNLAQVDASIWRSGQPASKSGWDYVGQLAAGRRVHIIKLNFVTEGSDDLANGRGWDLVYLPIQPEGDRDAWDDAVDEFRQPDETSVEHAEVVLAQCFLHPDTDFCLVHCTHGQDRTGYVTGRHRVEHEKWTAHRAFSEMIQHDFHWELAGLMVAWLKFSSGK